MKKILIVDDTPSNIDILVGFLGEEYELFISLDGYQALNILAIDIPDLILLDIRMPGIDGFETCQQIKQMPLVSKVPIIFLTAETDEESIKNAFISGGVDYIKKPLILQELKARIETHINLFSYTNNLEILVQEKTNQIKEYLYIDKITLLKNSASLKEEIENFKDGSLFILDINNFNIYNKLNGFSYGNKILKVVAIELQKIIKNDFHLYKLSIDRFAIICKEYNKYLIDSFCKNIFNYFDNLSLQIDTIDNFVNFCIGVTKISNYENSIIEAEYALDYAKTQSNGTYITYDENSSFVQEEYESISSLMQVRAYILEKKIVPFFQPIVDVHTEQIVKYEALARIKDVDMILTPDKFLKSAERLGMLCDITKDMIIKSFEIFKSSNIRFSINLTQKDILDRNLLSFIKNNAVFYNINLSNVTFEILENLTLAEDDTKIRTVISSLKQNGCEIAIDDFGSENSNFSRLLSLQSDYIKIDGLFIKNCDKEIEKQKIIKAIVELSRTLGIKCVAEFVSSKEIFDTIKSLGVDFAQGYYFGEPNPLEKL